MFVDIRPPGPRVQRPASPEISVCRWLRVAAAALCIFVAAAPRAHALDRLCDPGAEDCRAILLNYINAEHVGIDVGFWFMEDARYTAALSAAWQRGVRIRVLVDPRANATNPFNADRLNELQTAGIPMRKRIASGILHYKMMLFAGQNVVEFSGANYSADAWRPADLSQPYVNYTDESIYFTDDLSIVHSFMGKYDDLWTDTTSYANYANVPETLVREYGPPGTYTKDPTLNFPPAESYASRAVSAYNKETSKIDVIMYRITDRRHTDAMIAAHGRGIPIRLISEPEQYRDVTRLWDSWNIDRMYAAGIPIKMRAHQGLNHQKLVLLYSQGLAIFGSSNWTSASDKSQEEHNCFCNKKPSMFTWFTDQFERKWNNSAGVVENADFVPLPPDKPLNELPANAATSVATSSVTMKWYGGPWAHRYDVYFGTDASNLALVMADQELGPSESSTQYQSFTVASLQPGTTYYWRVVSRTMAGLTKTGDLWSFTTAGVPAPPPSNGTLGPGDILIYGVDGRVTGTAWQVAADSSAAGAQRLWNPNQNAAKITTASANPASYVEFTFTPVAGQPYHLWIRGKAQNDVYSNDSIFVQFSGALSGANGTSVYQIGTTSAAEYNLENCSGCGVSGWGWQDTAYGLNVAAASLYFGSGEQTLRIQTREDGLSIDQIMLSPSKYFTSAPGALKNDATIYPRSGSGTPPPPPPSTALPSPWVSRDIGSVGIAGSASFDSSTEMFTLKGAGADVWGSADAFQFAYEPLSGDGSIVARVATIQNVNAWTKAGVMIRETLSAASAHAFMLVSPGKGLAFQRRPVAGGTSVSTAGAAATAPYWVRLTRNGNLISAYQSPDGSTWTLVGTDTISMGASVYIGLAVSSHTTSATATATFTNVTVQ
jgi:phosphatidylserine/phosphatidylglycerophosphate/cardiolipin synthase-like enzyme